jgi:hypothetical protein
VNRRDAVAEDLRALADNLRSLYASATTDPRERRRKELQWTALQAALGTLATVAGRKLVLKLWGILTGEQPPRRPPTEPVRGSEPGPAPMSQPPPETPPDPLTQVMSHSEAETMSSSSSSMK